MGWNTWSCRTWYYILNSFYFKYLKQSKYKNHKFVLFVQKRHINFVKHYYSEYFDDIVVYEKDNKHLSKETKDILKSNKFKALINLAIFRSAAKKSNPVRTKFVKICCAEEKIGAAFRIEENGKTVISKLLKRSYDKLILSEMKDFELERCRQFFEEILETPIPKEEYHIEPIIDFKKDYITISLMAMNECRMMSDKKWVEIIDYILEKTPKELNLIFVGSLMDLERIQKVIDKVQDKNRCINISGLTDEALIPTILYNGKFQVSVETGTIHIARFVGCQTLCLSSGIDYKRYHPHEKYIDYIYTKDFHEMQKDCDEETLKKLYLGRKEVSKGLENIDINEVKSKLDEYIEKFLS